MTTWIGKLIDFPIETLERSDNPFAMVTLAHVQAKRTRHRPEERFQSKRSLIRRLHEQGFDRQRVIDLFRFIDWVMRLPKHLDDQLIQEILEFEESQKMPYITSAERYGEERGRLLGIQIGLQEGRQEGRQEGEAKLLQRQLQRRFGALPEWVQEKLVQADSRSLETWSLRIFDARNLEELFDEPV
ncbi:MAG: DUF4351 domain-containing protein [Magnetococcales bacterium]|nr:DUF4351 domain-containing protein [Magnetococcales bacterium]